MLFNGGTTITTIDIPEIPYNIFNFKPFGDFLHGDFQVDRLYDNLSILFFSQSSCSFQTTFHLKCSYYADVIGVLRHIVNTQVTGAGKKACVNRMLSDEWYI